MEERNEKDETSEKGERNGMKIETINGREKKRKKMIQKQTNNKRERGIEGKG